jgi:hypothetical protein
MDILVGIGSQMAMTALVRLHQHPRNSVRKAARARLSILAAARGLTEEALEDSLVPHLGLDDQGTLAFDLGPRVFHLGLDSRLKPHIRDAAGKRASKLPKAGPGDDPNLSAQAHLQWKAFCKALKGVSKAHIPRLERAMVNGRRWSRADFFRHLGTHPVLRHVVRALVWAGWEGEEIHPSVTFRVSSGGEFVDQKGGVIDVPDGFMIGIVHPADLDSAQSCSWAAAFSSLDLDQPFAQLERVVRSRDAGPTPPDLVGTHGAVGYWRGLTTSGWGISDVPGAFDGYAAGLVYRDPRGGCLEITLEEGYQLGRGKPAHASYTVTRCREDPPLSARAYSEAVGSLHFLEDPPG